MKKARAGMFVALLVGLAPGLLQASPIGSGDPFSISFNEIGLAHYSVYQGPSGTTTGFFAIDPNTGANALTYQLPENVSAGLVGVTENNIVGDVMSFYNIGAAGYMAYYSLPGPAPADIGVPQVGFVGAQEINGSFLYVAGNGDPASTNFYYGVSDSPEPASLVLLSAGLAGFGLFSLIKKRKSNGISA